MQRFCPQAKSLISKSFEQNLMTFDEMAKGCEGEDDTDYVVPQTYVVFVVVT